VVAARTPRPAGAGANKHVVELSSDLHRQPTVAEIAHAARATEEEVLEALQASGAHRATSLQAPRGGEDEACDTLGDTLASTEQGFGLAEDRATLALRAITPRERDVLRLHFEDDLTQRQIAQRIGVSQMQTPRIIRHSIAGLRIAARAYDSDGSGVVERGRPDRIPAMDACPGLGRRRQDFADELGVSVLSHETVVVS
jgi:RNA polymerase sigma factor (sigma-70 family)